MDWLTTHWFDVALILYAAASEIIGISPLKNNSIVQLVMAIFGKLLKRPTKVLILPLLVTLCLNFVYSGVAYAAGSCTRTSKELIQVEGRTQRIYITLTCTGDGSIAAYSFDPTAEGVRGMYLYNVTTNPGTAAPTNLYDITLVTEGEDIAGTLLNNRSDTATETVAIAPTTKGYHMTDQAISITFANEAANPSTIVMKLRFTVN